MMKKNMICVVCPMGCHLEVEQIGEQVNVTGNQCKRGIVYGKEELLAPKRVLPTTVKITGAIHERLPVKSSQPVLKELLFDMMDILNKIQVKSPIKVGDVIVENILNTGVDIVATRSM